MGSIGAENDRSGVKESAVRILWHTELLPTGV